MAFDARCFWHAKDLASVADYEDAFDVDPSAGRAAIADGVSTAIFSRRWAQLLTSSSVASPPAWEDDAAVNAWILDQRKAWAKSINVHSLPWMQKAKLEQSGGAYAAFLWVELQPLSVVGQVGLKHAGAGLASNAVGGFRCRSVAVGDCCLFHVRGTELLGRFPLACEADFNRDPLTFCSSSRNRQPQPPLQRCDFECHAGDWIVLSSDALAKWLYRLSDAGQPIDWSGLWRQDAYTWTQRVGSLRLLNASERVRVDDTTLLILRVGHAPATAVVEASEAAIPEAAVAEAATPEAATPEVAVDLRTVDLRTEEESGDARSATLADEVVVADLADDEHPVEPAVGQALAPAAGHDVDRTEASPAQPAVELTVVEDIEPTSEPHAIGGDAGGGSVVPSSPVDVAAAACESPSNGETAEQLHSRPSEGSLSEGSPSESRLSEGGPSESRPSESRPSESRPSESRPSESRPSESRLSEGGPSESHPSEGGLSEGSPSESRPSEGGLSEGGLSEGGLAEGESSQRVAG